MIVSTFILFVGLVVVSLIARNNGVDLLENKEKLDINVLDFGKCVGYDELPNYYEDLSLILDPDTHLITVNGVFVLNKPIEEGIIVKVIFLKCQTQYPESCAKNFEFNVTDCCNKLKDKDQAWSDFFAKLEIPKHECPIPKGRYNLIDAPLNTSFVKDATVFMGYWRVRMENIVDDKLTLCAEVSTEIKKQRRPRKH